MAQVPSSSSTEIKSYSLDDVYALLDGGYFDQDEDIRKEINSLGNEVKII